MKIKRIEHVAIAVHNMAESMTMLENTLGLELDYEETIGDTKLAMYPVGETFVELLQAGGTTSPVADWVAERGQSLFHLCFEVEDIDAALDEMRAKGVKLLDETPKSGHGGSRIAFLDPASTGDILIELAELPADHS
ncbi:MAG: VOC family protein [Rhodospirillaceae bacterium]|nr:VOC family protein [Rhodospirillaceae bacterium]MBT5191729.1 VOC family protein [Rhodospirillaceae bacterium]MBT5899056.1 VOC family protein [Rhodospirillaceae bacterium]MBT7761101.1 VOC family protein [Rhodospirillaceae bacterium]